MKDLLSDPSKDGWQVSEDGSMVYQVEGKDPLMITPNMLNNPEFIYQLRGHPDFDMNTFFIKWIEALENAKIDKVTFLINNEDGDL